MNLDIYILIVLLAVIAWPKYGLAARWRSSRRASGRTQLEDALKHIFACEQEGRDPSLQSIAGALSTSANEAAQVCSRLESQRLLDLAHGEFKLTPPGREYALRIVRAHRLLEQFLSERTGYGETEWHAIAEEGEHRLSPDEANALAASLANPSHDPHGDPIPTAEGWFAASPGQPLSSLAAGSSARIVHLEDEPAVIYSQILAEGLHTGLELRVMESTPERLRFWAGGDEHVLAPLLANNISVVPVPEKTTASRAGTPLTRLNPGDSARVLALAPAIRGAERRRLMDLGLIPGTQISAELRSPSGDPTAYLVRGALIALRADQARHIRVESTPVRN